jgi:hypothetical protein
MVSMGCPLRVFMSCWRCCLTTQATSYRLQLPALLQGHMGRCTARRGAPGLLRNPGHCAGGRTGGLGTTANLLASSVHTSTPRPALSDRRMVCHGL